MLNYDNQLNPISSSLHLPSSHLVPVPQICLMNVGTLHMYVYMCMYVLNITN